MDWAGNQMASRKGKEEVTVQQGARDGQVEPRGRAENELRAG